MDTNFKTADPQPRVNEEVRQAVFQALLLVWGFRIVIVAILLLIPLGSALICAIGLIRPREPFFGPNLVGKTRLYSSVRDGNAYLEVFTGWKATPPRRGEILDIPGVRVYRAVVTLTGQASGDVITSIQIRWWLIMVMNIPPLLISWLLLRHMRWPGRSKAGRCVVCGYDLRATPERCPECGTPTSK